MDSSSAFSCDDARYVSSLHREFVIADFVQIEGESFSDAWRRFTDLVSGRQHQYTLT